MRAESFAVAVVFGVFVFGAPALGYHSFAAEYDTNQPIKVSGVVTKMEWMNPHARQRHRNF